MKRRNILLGSGVIALTIVNIWKWWPEGADNTRAMNASRDKVRIDELVLNVDTSQGSDIRGITRDIFQPKRVSQKIVRPVTKPDASIVKPPPVPPEELEHNAALTELGEYRCVGIAAHSGQIQAFLLRGEQTLIVSRGDRISNRFVVEKIESNTVFLTDASSGVNGTISLSGK